MQKGHPQFYEFEQSSKLSWLKQVEKELKGKRYEELFWSTEEGITLEPYYTEADQVPLLPIPAKVFQGGANRWVLRQKYWANELEKNVIQGLQHGVEALEIFDPAIPLRSEQLKEVHIQMVELTGHSDGDLMRWKFLEKLCVERGLKPEEISGSLTLDISDIRGSQEDRMNLLQEWLSASSAFKHMRTIGIDAARHAECGANAVTELAIALSKGHAAVHSLLPHHTIDEIAGIFEVKLTSGLSYFKDIAKIRAMRYLWFKMIEAYEPQHACSNLVWIHTDTTAVNYNQQDSYVNLIRGTSAAMSAALGGSDSLTVKPFDYLEAKNSRSGLRWARNIQHILVEESNLHLVSDPAKGSWYLENLTYQLAERAWELFCDWEEQGGFFLCENTSIGDSIKCDREALIHKVAEGDRIILGVNRFKPNPDAKRLSVDWAALEQEIPGRLNLSRELENRKTQLS